MNCLSKESLDNDLSTDMVFAEGLPRHQQQSSLALSPLDHSAILTCINPKAFWYPSPGLSAAPLRTSLGLVLRDYPVLAGRMAGGKSSVRAMRHGMTGRISVNNAGEPANDSGTQSSGNGITIILVNRNLLAPQILPSWLIIHALRSLRC